MYLDGDNRYHQNHDKQEQHRKTKKANGYVKDWREKKKVLLWELPLDQFVIAQDLKLLLCDFMMILGVALFK